MTNRKKNQKGKSEKYQTGTAITAASATETMKNRRLRVDFNISLKTVMARFSRAIHEFLLRCESRGCPACAGHDDYFTLALWLIRRRIVRRFAGDGDIMHVAFTQAGRGDADELGFVMQLLDRLCAGVAHRCFQAAC